MDRAGLVGGDPRLQRHHLAHGALGGFFDLPEVKRLQGDLPADELLLENLEYSLQAVLGGRSQRELLAGQLDARVRPLEVKASLELARRLVYRVAGLLHVHLRDDIKRRHVQHASLTFPEGLTALEGRCPSGQWEQTVNLPADAYGGSNPSRPTRWP